MWACAPSCLRAKGTKDAADLEARRNRDDVPSPSSTSPTKTLSLIAATFLKSKLRRQGNPPRHRRRRYRPRTVERLCPMVCSSTSMALTACFTSATSPTTASPSPKTCSPSASNSRYAFSKSILKQRKSLSASSNCTPGPGNRPRPPAGRPACFWHCYPPHRLWRIRRN